MNPDENLGAPPEVANPNRRPDRCRHFSRACLTRQSFFTQALYTAPLARRKIHRGIQTESLAKSLGVNCHRGPPTP